MYCPNCGAQIVEGSSFCSKCGRNVSAVSKTVSSRATTSNPINRLHRMHLCMLVFLSAITFGIYYPIWFLKQEDALNKFDSGEKLNQGIFITCIILTSVSLLFGLVAVIYEGSVGSLTSESRMLDGIGSICGFVSSIILIVQAFNVRRIFIDHFQENLSGLATFFFGALYLQYKINRF